jgi:glycosyltransferase involved in cell wall biosynthesis
VPRISVCLATYNGAAFISDQVASILPQLGSDDELVVSDDSSSDATVEMMRSLADRRIRLFSRAGEPNPVRNFENAISHATGEIIVLSDQDDVWLDNKLSVVHEHLDSRCGTVSLIMLDGLIVDAFDQRVLEPSIIRATRAGPGLLKNIYDNTYRGSCLAFTRPLLRVGLPFPDGIPMHDMWLGLLAELFGQVEFVPIATIRYRRHQANASPMRIRLNIPVQARRRIALCRQLLARTIKLRMSDDD